MALFGRKKKDTPFGLWMKCPSCGQMLFTKAVEENFHVCTSCDFHMKVNGPTRVAQLLDAHSFSALGGDLASGDPLGFRDEGGGYAEVLERTRARSGVSEAVTAGTGLLDGRPVVLSAMDFTFRGGSMGVVVGERVARAAEAALEGKCPFILVATSGGARMQEGALSLMQMAKSAAVLARLKEEAVPYVVVLADPCTGGVSASFAALGDITLAEPGALIGFAGPRVIQNTIRTQLPEGFQRAEFLLEKGYIDRIVHRRELKQELGRILDYLSPRVTATAADPAAEASGA